MPPVGGPFLPYRQSERGDLYAVMNLSTYIMSIVRLAADRPDEAEVKRKALEEQLNAKLAASEATIS